MIRILIGILSDRYVSMSLSVCMYGSYESCESQGISRVKLILVIVQNSNSLVTTTQNTLFVDHRNDKLMLLSNRGQCSLLDLRRIMICHLRFAVHDRQSTGCLCD